MYAQDRFGCRPTMMFFMAWMTVMIFIPVFAPSLSVLAFGEAMCGVSWGVFQVRTCFLYSCSMDDWSINLTILISILDTLYQLRL